jgi:hypothetical protein
MHVFFIICQQDASLQERYWTKRPNLKGIQSILKFSNSTNIKAAFNLKPNYVTNHVSL